jgi:pimeloyl-ACP methyl ester carboxylesterase
MLKAAETADLSVNGTRVRTYQWKPNSESDGNVAIPTVMVVHGWGGSVISMQSFIKPLLLNGFRVVSFDAPAHGNSSGVQTNMLQTAASLKHVAHEVGPLDAIVGHSFGGMVGAASLMGLGNEPPLENIDRLVLISSPNRLEDILSRYGDQFRMAHAVRRCLRKRIEKVAGRPIQSISISNFVNDSNVTTLVIHDRHDKEVPVSDGKAIARHAPSTSFMETEGLGHRRILLSSSVAEAVVDFLKDEMSANIESEPAFAGRD